MSWAIGFASIMTSLFTVLAIHPFESEVINAICFPTLSLLYLGSLLLAEYFENKLEKQIEVLEKKLKDREKGGATDTNVGGKTEKGGEGDERTKNEA